MKNAYYEGCSNEIEGDTTSPLYRQVDGYPLIDEYTLFSQNKGILKFL